MALNWLVTSTNLDSISTDFEHVSVYHEARVIPPPFYPDDSYISIRILISQGDLITEKIINKNTIKCIRGADEITNLLEGKSMMNTRTKKKAMQDS